jgi:hypothetical protein
LTKTFFFCSSEAFSGAQKYGICWGIVLRKCVFVCSVALLLLMIAAMSFIASAEALLTEYLMSTMVSVYSPERGKVYRTNSVELNFSWSKYAQDSSQVPVWYSIDGDLVNVGTSTVSSSYTTTWHNLSEGYHLLKIILSGAFFGDAFDVEFYVDTVTPPNVTILSPTDTTYPKEPQLQFLVDKPVSWMGYSLDGQNNVTLTEKESNLPDLSNGPHSLTVYANDTRGNMVGSEPVYFVVDKILPAVSVLAPESKTYYNAEISLNFTVNEQVSEITYCLDGQENVTLAGNVTLTGLPDGNHNLIVYVADEAGNIGVSETIRFKVDTFFPFLLFGVASVAVVVAAGLILYFKKRKH